jgi:AcrR family transcriptional regulator
MATTSRGARSRRAIVTAAAELFAERGFANASVNEVLDRVGLTKGAFYFHFETKEQLAHAVSASYHEWLLELQEQGSKLESDPLRRIPRVLLEASLAYRRDPVARGTTRLLEESNQLKLPYLTPVWVRWWTRTLAEAQAAGRLDPEIDVARLSWVLVAGWYGSVSNSYIESEWVGLPDRMADLLRFTLLPAVVDPTDAAAVAEDIERLVARVRSAHEMPQARPGWLDVDLNTAR